MDENVIFNNSNSDTPKDEQNPANPIPQETNSVPVETGPESVAPPPIQDPQVSIQPDSAQAASLPSDGAQEAQVPPVSPPPPIGKSRWKKIIIGVVLIVLVVFFIFLFLPKGASNKKVTLVWWGLWEDQRVMHPIISDFQKQNPNITIKYTKQDPKQYREKLVTRIKNGTGPDIYRFHNTWVPMLSEFLQPLPTDVISPNEFKKTFYPVMQGDLTLNGGIYGIPVGADTLALFINTELFEAAGLEPPTTWEDFVKIAPKLTVKDDEGKIRTAGAALGTYGNITHAPDILSLLFIQQGVDMKNFPTTDIKKKTDVLDFYTAFAKGEERVWDSTLDESVLSFARGNLAMYIGFSWDIFRIQSINNNLTFKTYPVPQLVGKTNSYASYWVEGVSSESKNQKEALMFMQYLTKKETAQKLYSEASKVRAFGEPHARMDLKDTLKDNELVYPFVAQLPSASSSIFAGNTNDGTGGINTLANIYLGNAINSIIDDNGSTQTAIETLDKGVDQVYEKYGIR
jgi:multiple sugar transport system substrate-binding protein